MTTTPPRKQQPRKKKGEKKPARLKTSQLKVLAAIYSVTDCCNGVYQYATLHWRQGRIADAMPRLVSRMEGVASVDGDGFLKIPERYGTGYKLTRSGYAALSNSNPERFPIH
jgi:hypothetical protein